MITKIFLLVQLIVLVWLQKHRHALITNRPYEIGVFVLTTLNVVKYQEKKNGLLALH